MSFIEEIFKGLYDNHLFTPGDQYSLGSLLQNISFPIPDVIGIDLKTSLTGGCTQGSPEGNATLDLTNIQLSGLKSFHKGDPYTYKSTNEYAQFDVPMVLSGPRVPAHPEDFDPNGLPITGALSLKGITDFPGLVVNCNFAAHQACTEGGPVDPSGKLIATANDLKLSITFQIYISDRIDVKIPTLLINEISADKITITMLRSDGSLPEYNFNDIPMPRPLEAIHFFFAQNGINFPSFGDLPLYMVIADKVNYYISENNNDDSLNAKIRHAIEQKITEYLNNVFSKSGMLSNKK